MDNQINQIGVDNLQGQKTSVSPVIPVSPEKRPKSITTILFTLLIIILLGAVGFVTYQNYQLKNSFKQEESQSIPTVTPTPDPTADWETYINTKYSYQLKYPPSWRINSMAGEKDYSQTLSVNLRAKSDEIPAESGFSIVVIPNIDNLSLTEWIKQNPDNGRLLPSNTTQTVPSSVVTINGISWEKIDTDLIGSVPTGDVIYGTPHNGNLYSIVLYLREDINMVDQILSTFKFTLPSLSPTSSENINIGSMFAQIQADLSEYSFDVIDPYVFDFTVDSNTKKIISGSSMITNAAEIGYGINSKLFVYLISLGFEENTYNAAGPDFGTSKDGAQLGNTVCIVEAGYFGENSTRLARISCGQLPLEN